MFPFIAAFIDKATGCCHQAPLTTAHAAYVNLLGTPFFTIRKAKDVKYYPAEIENYFEIVRDSGMHLFWYVNEKNLFTLKFHALNHVTKDVKRFEDIFLSNALAFDHCYKTICLEYSRRPWQFPGKNR